MEEEKTNIQEIKAEFENVDTKELEEMMEAGVMYGHKKSKTDPRFKPFIFTTRNGVEIIDITKTVPAIEKAAAFLKETMQTKGGVIMVATQPAAQETVNDMVKSYGFSHVTLRWIGGLLTNYSVLSKRIDYYKRMKSALEKGELDKYTKRERSVIARNVEKMRKMFEGVEGLSGMPAVMVVIDPSLKGHTTAVREAHRMGIPIIAVTDSDDNPNDVLFPIPANDHAKASIAWVFKTMKEKIGIVKAKSQVEEEKPLTLNMKKRASETVKNEKQK